MMDRHERNIASLLKNQTARRLTREERNRRRERIIATLIGIALGALFAWLCVVSAGADVESPAPVPEPTEAIAEVAATTEESSEADENELIEAALLARAQRIDNVTVTHYDVCVACCGKTSGITASGVRATPGVTVAVDPDTIPLGSDVLVDYGDGELFYYRADDVGGAVKGNHIDLCVEDHETALALGRRTATVWWVGVEQ